MKPFTFSLQALLTLREEQEQRALQEYTRTLVLRERAMSALHDAEEDLHLAWARWEEKVAEQTTAAELRDLHAFCDVLSRRRVEKEKLLAVATSETKRAFGQLLEARQAKAVLEKYAENEERRHAQLKRRQEQKAMDDRPQSQAPLLTMLGMRRSALWN